MNAVAEVRRQDVLGEEVHAFRLPSGLRVLAHRKPGFTKRFGVLAADFGSVDRSFVDHATGRTLRMPDGVAHFLEHKLFEYEGGDAFEHFSKRGANANAATSFRHTAFFFTCSDRLLENVRLLLRMVGSAEFSEASVDKEREIIDQEIRMYEDSPEWSGLNLLVQGLYTRHPVRADITGSRESVRRIDRAALLACYENFYDPANLCLVVSGDEEPEALAAAAARALPAGRYGRPARRIPVREPRGVARRRVEVRLPVTRPKLFVGFKDPAVPVADADLQRRDAVTGILLALLFGSSSRTWQKLYESGTIDDSFYPSYAGEEDFGFVTLSAEVDDPDRVRRALFRAIREFGRRPIDTEDFGRVVHKMIGRFVRGLDSQEATAFMLLASEFRGLDPFRVPTLLRQITPDEVLERHSQLFGDRNHCTSVVLP